MLKIYNLFNSTDNWASNVNLSLEIYRAEYLQTFGHVGSQKWIELFNNGLIPKIIIRGEVVFIGDRFNELWNELDDIVEIRTSDGAIYQYDHLGYWSDERIVIGTVILVESFKIEVSEKYGLRIFGFESSLSINNH